MTLNKAINEATKYFTRTHKNHELRVIALGECCGTAKKYSYVGFIIDYVEEPEGNYKKTIIQVLEKDNKIEHREIEW